MELADNDLLDLLLARKEPEAAISTCDRARKCCGMLRRRRTDRAAHRQIIRPGHTSEEVL